MDKNEKAIKELQKGIMSYIDAVIKQSPFDKTIIGKVVEINGTKANILFNQKIYKNIPKLSTVSISVNDIVKITIPQNNMSNMYIEGKLG